MWDWMVFGLPVAATAELGQSVTGGIPGTLIVRGGDPSGCVVSTASRGHGIPAAAIIANIIAQGETLPAYFVQLA
jgi:hypothetical protein